MATKSRNKKGEMFMDNYISESEITLPWIDRIRLLCGSRLFVSIIIGRSRFNNLQTKTYAKIEKVFRWRNTSSAKVKAVGESS